MRSCKTHAVQGATGKGDLRRGRHINQGLGFNLAPKVKQNAPRQDCGDSAHANTTFELLRKGFGPCEAKFNSHLL
jgi:hypothetical protein